MTVREVRATRRDSHFLWLSVGLACTAFLGPAEHRRLMLFASAVALAAATFRIVVASVATGYVA